MRRHRFIVRGVDLDRPRLTLYNDYAHQLRSVLRAREEDELLVCDGAGREALGIIRTLKGEGVTVELGPPYELETEPTREVTINAAITKRDTFEWACQKATECGATKLVPVLTERTVKQNIDLERLRRIVKEAAEQSGRGIVPQVAEITAFEEVLAAEEALRYIAATTGGTPLGEIDLAGAGSIAVLIGPEGGFSEREEEAARDAGWEAVSLGTRILRAETAVTVAAYLAAR